MTLKDFILEESKKKRKIKDRPKKPADMPNAYKFNQGRGLNRKNLRQVPISHTVHPLNTTGFTQFVQGMDVTNNIINTAKVATSGIWKVSAVQAAQIAEKYGFKVPNNRKPHKHLGSMSIQLVKFGRSFFLYKPHKPKKPRKRHLSKLSDIGKIF